MLSSIICFAYFCVSSDALLMWPLAYILINQDKQVIYSAAGHPPIFHLHRNTVARHSVENLPVAMFPGTSYETAAIDFEPGDMLAIVTDGLTEVFDSKNRELGDSYISTILMRLSSRPLREISDEIFKTARSFGKMTDDQSLLIARRQRKPNQGTVEQLAEVPGSESTQFAYGERYERLLEVHCSI